ncbi:MAG TPA: phosphatase PAP2 family protein, partial [Pseudonocardiaceae bacterium]|nr:phosphatase PAP2 family protein [Pseudonocardiaceae bacterium]
MASQVNLIDRELVRRSAAIPPTPVDTALKALTTAANHSLLWFTVASLLAGRKGRARWAALRGVLAISGASFTANILGKPVLPRRRPAYEDVPVKRRLAHAERPGSSSFPSGHAASAAAFATAVTMESPVVGMAVAPVAAAVAYSRVHTGVHWPSDVAAGMLLGTGVALATQRWWPLRVEEAAESSHPAQVPTLPNGEGLVVVVNPYSGVDGEHPGDELAVAWPAARLVFCKPDIDLTEQLAGELDDPDRPVQALGVAGGDGTVAGVAAVAASRGLPLVVVPSGTFNHFARDVGVTSLQDAVAAVCQGSAIAVDLGAVEVDDEPPRWFVNTASLGGYPDLVRFREQLQPRWGKWPAAAAALIRVLRESDPLTVLIDNVPQQVWLMFVGNGPYRPRGLAAAARHRLDTGALDVRYIRADRRLSRTRFLVGALSGALEQSRTYVQDERTELRVEILGHPVALATDGEVSAEGTRFRFGNRPAALQVYRPGRAPGARPVEQQHAVWPG